MNVKDNQGGWQRQACSVLLCKASSLAEGWMKSTKAMEIPGVGCVVHGHHPAAQSGRHSMHNGGGGDIRLPGVRIKEDENGGRRLDAA